MPSLAYQRIVREQETAEEAIHTAQIVPPTDRGQDPPRQQSIVEDIVIELAERSNPSPAEPEPGGGPRPTSVEEETSDETAEQVFELRSSAMFNVDDQEVFAEQEKLDFIR
ncbi:hypothetical protein IMZ48_07750, partial [Candidatus Bathyarchaeota archaeon]|nr:hypothetical protein [Candidatus Bathyarchaeota archaeon]